jgi:hypothetical protein
MTGEHKKFIIETLKLLAKAALTGFLFSFIWR